MGAQNVDRPPLQVTGVEARAGREPPLQSPRARPPRRCSAGVAAETDRGTPSS